MIVKKPAVMIYTNHPEEGLLREVCAGIEEEGVLCQIQEMSGDVRELAFLAAKDSILGTGIGIQGTLLAMQMQRIPKERPVFELDSPQAWQCRNLGMNSARAVKKQPFKAVTVPL